MVERIVYSEVYIMSVKGQSCERVTGPSAVGYSILGPVGYSTGSSAALKAERSEGEGSGHGFCVLRLLEL